MHVKFLDTLDWGILIAYFLILIAIGVWASSKRKKEAVSFGRNVLCDGTTSDSLCGERTWDLPC